MMRLRKLGTSFGTLVRAASALRSTRQSAGIAQKGGVCAALVALGLGVGCNVSHEPPELGQSEPNANAEGTETARRDGTGATQAAVPLETGMVAPAAANRASGSGRCGALPSAVAQRWIAFDSDREGYNRDLFLVMGDGSHLMRITNDPATEREPAFAPDGTQLAYASDASGSMQVHVLNLQDGTTRQLTHRAEGADQPSWSHDGRQLVFHSAASIYVIDADGQSERLIATGLDAFNAYKYPSLSPDGKVVVFDRNNEIDAVNLADGSSREQIVKNTTTTEESPAISPDGQSVAYAVVCSTGERIEVVPFGESTSACEGTAVTSARDGNARRPAWGPSNYLAFERSPAAGSGSSAASTFVAISAGPGSAPCDVVDGPGRNLNPSWAPEGFSPSPAISGNAVSESDQAQASAGGSCSALGAEVARRWIAFDSDREQYNRDLYLVRLDGSDLRRLTSSPATEKQPAFAPDGKRLAYVSDESGTMQIYLRDLALGSSVQLTQHREGADQPSWSSNGAQLVFHSGHSVYIIDADGSREREIARDDMGGGYEYPTLSPDGTQLVFDRHNEIDAVQIDGSGKRYVVQNWTTTEEMPAISPDGHSVAYSVVCYATAQIAVVPLAGYAADPCKVTFATSADQGAARRPAWGPNGMIAFERTGGGAKDGGGTAISVTAGPGRAQCDVFAGPFQNHNPSWAPQGFEP